MNFTDLSGKQILIGDKSKVPKIFVNKGYTAPAPNDLIGQARETPKYLIFCMMQCKGSFALVQTAKKQWHVIGYKIRYLFSHAWCSKIIFSYYVSSMKIYQQSGWGGDHF